MEGHSSKRGAAQSWSGAVYLRHVGPWDRQVHAVHAVEDLIHHCWVHLRGEAQRDQPHASHARRPAVGRAPDAAAPTAPAPTALARGSNPLRPTPPHHNVPRHHIPLHSLQIRSAAVGLKGTHRDAGNLCP